MTYKEQFIKLNKEYQAVCKDLKLTKQRVAVNLQRIANYSELLQMAVSLLTKKQYKEYEKRFWKIKEKQNQNTITEMERLVTELFGL